MNRKTIGLLLVSLAILAVMLWYVGIDEVIEALKYADMTFIILAIVVQFFTFYLYTLRWNIINKVANIHISNKELLPMILVGLGVNNITPAGRGGGEPVRAYVLSREKGYPMEETFATVLADRALDTFPFVILAIVTLVGATLYFNLDLWLIVTMVVAVIAIIAVLFILVYMSVNENFKIKLTNWIISLSQRFYKKHSDEFEEKITEVIAGFQETMNLLIHERTVRYQALPLSFIIWGFEIFRVYLVFLAFGANINPIIIGEVFILASLIGMIPLLPGGVGAVDGVMILFYSAAGVTASVSAAATVVERLISFWMVTFIGLIAISYYGSSILDKISLSSSSKDSLEESSSSTSQLSSGNNDEEN